MITQRITTEHTFYRTGIHEDEWYARFMIPTGLPTEPEFWISEGDIEKEIRCLYDVMPKGYEVCMEELVKGLRAIRTSQELAKE